MLLIIFLILIIIYILYVLFIKYSYTTEKFDNNNDNKNEYGLLKYSSINISDIYKLQTLLNSLNESFYVKIIDTHINNINDLVNKINENIQETIRKTNNQYLNDNIYVSIYPDIDLTKTTFTKIIIVYPNYYEKDNKLIYKNNITKFNQYVKENNFGGNLIVYKIDKTNQLFSHYLQ